MSIETAIALNRFGLGARPDEAAPDQPKRWLLDQFGRFDPNPAPIAAAPTRAQVAGELADYLEEARALGPRKQRAAQAMSPMQPNAPAAAPALQPVQANPAKPAPAADDPAKQLRQTARRAGRDNYIALIGARTQAALVAPAPFVERLVHFWANHFAVSADKLTVVGLAGLLEFEAIRPHVLGNFADMLGAVERHPAMLLYLDQAQSIGPNSRFGARVAARNANRKIGLNENLAREIMELHTLGVRAGYSQADVTEFARALTGWTVSGIARGPAARVLYGENGVPGAPGDFVFIEALHEPGARTILGKSYSEGGEAQASAVLADLAINPATAKHIATKLARHFTSDDPPPALVARLQAAFLQGRGDLPTVYRALIEAPETWSGKGRFKTPWDWTVSSLRAVGAKTIEGQPAAGLLTQLGQPVWKPGSPAGYDDVDASWLGPDALVRRVEAADRIAAKAAGAIDARTLAPKLLPAAVTPATAQALARAESPAQGLALLLVAPEFMRR